MQASIRRRQEETITSTYIPVSARPVLALPDRHQTGFHNFRQQRFGHVVLHAFDHLESGVGNQVLKLFGVCRKTCSAASWLALRPRVALVRWSLTAGNGCLDLFTNWRDEPVPLCEGHYKISPIDTDDYLLSCCRYVERNPVKAGMVEAPEDYPGSSYAARIGLTHCDWLDGLPTMAELGSDASSRRERYRAFVSDGELSHQDHRIRAAIDRNKLTGGNRFVDEVLEIQVEEALVRQIKHDKVMPHKTRRRLWQK